MVPDLDNQRLLPRLRHRPRLQRPVALRDPEGATDEPTPARPRGRYRLTLEPTPTRARGAA